MVSRRHCAAEPELRSLPVGMMSLMTKCVPFPNQNRATALLLCTLLVLLTGCSEEYSGPKEPRAAIDQGWVLIGVAEWDRAEATFQYAADHAKAGSPDYLHARFGLGNAYQHRKPQAKSAEALDLYTKLAAEDKGGEIGAFAALSVVRIHHLKLYAPENLDNAHNSDSTQRPMITPLLLILSLFIGTGAAYLLKNRSKRQGLLALATIILIAWGIGSFLDREAPAAAEASAKPTAPSSLPDAAALDGIRAEYQQIVDAFPNTHAAEEAAIWIGSTWIAQMTPESINTGIASLTKWIDAHPKSDYLGNAYHQLSGGYEIQENYNDDLRVLIKWDDNNFDPTANHASAWFRIARIADLKVHDEATAKTYYHKFLDKYETEARRFLAERALQRLEGEPKKEGKP